MSEELLAYNALIVMLEHFDILSTEFVKAMHEESNRLLELMTPEEKKTKMHGPDHRIMRYQKA